MHVNEPAMMGGGDGVVEGAMRAFSLVRKGLPARALLLGFISGLGPHFGTERAQLSALKPGWVIMQ